MDGFLKQQEINTGQVFMPWSPPSNPVLSITQLPYIDGHSVDVGADGGGCRGGVWDGVCAGLTDVNFGGGDSQGPASDL